MFVVRLEFGARLLRVDAQVLDLVLQAELLLGQLIVSDLQRLQIVQILVQLFFEQLLVNALLLLVDAFDVHVDLVAFFQRGELIVQLLVLDVVLEKAILDGLLNLKRDRQRARLVEIVPRLDLMDLVAQRVDGVRGRVEIEFEPDLVFEQRGELLLDPVAFVRNGLDVVFELHDIRFALKHLVDARAVL